MKKINIIGLVSIVISNYSYALDCENALNTIDINECAVFELNANQKKMQTYLEASVSVNQHLKKLVQAIEISQKNWSKYADSHCDAVYEKWNEGSIRNHMYLSCKIRLTKERTFVLWNDYLTFVDTASPVLPRP